MPLKEESKGSERIALNQYSHDQTIDGIYLE